MRIFGRAGQNPAVEQDVERAETVDILELAAARIHEVVAAAEKAAGDIGDAAQAREPGAANRIDRDRLVYELARALADRAEILRREAGELNAVLHRGRATLDAAVVRPPQPPGPPPGPQAGPAPAPPSGHDLSRRFTRSSDGLHLLATQMWVAGSSRAEVEARLKQEFGVADAEPILSEVFGAGP